MLASLALALTLTGSATPRSYPIPPEPLRVLLARADITVVARVREASARESASGQSLFTNEYVALDIERVLKGDPGVGVLVVPHERGFICPAPARYEIGSRVLAFVDRTDSGGFRTHALSYGAKTLEPADLAVYLQRIAEQLAIERMPEGPDRLAEQVEWLVRCAEHPATRWEGAYELVTDVDGRFGARRSADRTSAYAKALTGAQRERLRAAFLAAESLDLGAGCLARFFQDDDDPRFLEWAVRRLRAVHEEVESSPYTEAGSLVYWVGRRDPRPEAGRIAGEFAALKSRGPGNDEGVTRLRLVRQLLTLYS
jgi:hypothetical protein